MGFRGLFLAIYISHQTLMTCDMYNKPKDSGLLPHAIGMTQLSKGIGILLGSMISGKQMFLFTWINWKSHHTLSIKDSIMVTRLSYYNIICL